MFSSKEVKTEPEQAEICLPVDHHLHSSCLDSYSTLGGALESTEPELVPDCVKTECDLSPVRPSDQTSNLRRTEKCGHLAYVTLRSQQNIPIENEAKESNITEFKKDPADCFDDFLEEFMKQKTKEEEAVNLNKTENVILHLSECEVSRSRVCCTLMYKRIKISNGGTKCPTYINRTFSKHNKIHGIDETQSYTDSKSCKGVDEKVEGHGKKKHFCQFCGRGYVHKCHLGVHMKTHTGERRHSCLECGAAFYHKYILKKHMMVHSQRESMTRTHICGKCGKSFPTPAYLSAHQKRHTEERHFPCTECGKRFKHGGDLKVHQKTHTGERPFTCTECGSSFQRNTTLKKHMRIHTGERPYLCSECGKTFPYAYSYSSHMEIHNRGN